MESAKRIPPGADQPAGDTPYSQVLEIVCSKLVVISGQVAEDEEENILGEDIKTQTRYALENCKRRLASADCTFADVFKTAIYLRNTEDWAAMNEVYTAMMPIPRPVRTAIQTDLLPGYLIEIEMWAAKK
ncbi:MAG: RidA family protein [Spirochaetaceae bacterium]|jgi:2-iminobutanoate/2-iminopropanoate deaminase|nr:RidA family protein [Spirochaetaceae bacterium]